MNRLSKGYWKLPGTSSFREFPELKEEIKSDAEAVSFFQYNVHRLKVSLVLYQDLFGD